MYHLRFDRECLPIYLEGIGPSLQGVPNLLWRTGGEELDDLRRESLVGLPDRGGLRFRHGARPGKIVRRAQDREVLRVHLIQENASKGGERLGRVRGRGPDR